MRVLRCIAVVAVLGSTLAACASPYYYNRYGYNQAYGYPSYSYYSSPGVTVAYTTGPSYAYAYPSYPSYSYGGTWDYYRNYRGIHPGPEYYP